MIQSTSCTHGTSVAILAIETKAFCLSVPSHMGCFTLVLGNPLVPSPHTSRLACVDLQAQDLSNHAVPLLHHPMMLLCGQPSAKQISAQSLTTEWPCA